MSPVRPNGKRIELETLGDVVKMLNPKEVRRRGVPEKIFTENGLVISAVAAGLRTRGYEVELFEQGGGPAAAAGRYARGRREAPRRRSRAALRGGPPQPALALRGRSVTGREMYERWCDAQLKSPDWWQIPEPQRLAWDRLADDVISDTEEGAAA